MIEYKVWLSQIIATCRIVVSDSALHSAWVDGDRGITSIVDFDEMYEQVFDDLDSDAVETQLPLLTGGDEVKCGVLSEFLSSIRNVDHLLEKDAGMRNPLALLESPQWSAVICAAKKVIAVDWGK